MHQKRFLLGIIPAIGALAATNAAASGGSAPLFVNLTTDDPHRIAMALAVGASARQRGHPVTIFLNDRGVFAGSTRYADRFAAQQRAMAELVQRSVSLLVCPMCMAHHGIGAGDVLPGLVISHGERLEAALFAESVRTLSW
jgi:sulfur relay (sulfurtransferase) complex TusBCD TusD component (DsrE family)